MLVILASADGFFIGIIDKASILGFLVKVFWYFTLRQAQGEDHLNPHAELVEALPRNFCHRTEIIA
jgi:hypothetical protein